MQLGPAQLPESAPRKGCAVVAQPSGNAATSYPSFLGTAQVAEILYVAQDRVPLGQEGKLPFLKTLGGHRRYPEAEIRGLARSFARRPRPSRPVAMKDGRPRSAIGHTTRQADAVSSLGGLGWSYGSEAGRGVGAAVRLRQWGRRGSPDRRQLDLPPRSLVLSRAVLLRWFNGWS